MWDFFVWGFISFRIHPFLSLDLYLFNILVCRSSATLHTCGNWEKCHIILINRYIHVSPSLLTQFMNEGWFPSAVVCWKSFRCVAIFKDKFCRAESLPPYVYLQTIFFSCRLKLVWNVVRLQLILLAAFLLTSLYPYILLQKRVFLKDCCPRGCLQHVFGLSACLCTLAV